MATKVSIVDVNLDVSGIISTEITEISGSTKAILQTMRNTQLEMAKIKQKATNAEDAAKTKIAAVVAKLVSAGPKGVPVAEIYTMVTPEINTIATTARIKGHLKAAGNEWALVKQKMNKIDRYILIPYNHEDVA